MQPECCFLQENSDFSFTENDKFIELWSHAHLHTHRQNGGKILLISCYATQSRRYKLACIENSTFIGIYIVY